MRTISCLNLKNVFTFIFTLYIVNTCVAEKSTIFTESESNFIATINAPDAVCIGDIFNANVSHGGTPPFDYEWAPVASNSFTVSISAGAPGNQTLSVLVTDAMGCQAQAQWDYEVFDDTPTPVINCCSVGITELCFCWDAVVGATGYEVTTLINGVTTVNTIITTDYCETDLLPGEKVEITVITISDNVCPSISSSATCVTSMNVDNDGDGVFADQDCDDSDPNNYPSNTESCDGQDNNCDGYIDEGFPISTYYLDADGDSFGDSNISLTDCENPDGYVLDNTDCDDTNPNINPIATDDTNNGIDENCDGVDGGSVAVSDIWNIDLNIWPNPADNILNIVIDKKADFNLQLLNINGRLINEYGAVEIIDISNLDQGTYLLWFTDKSSSDIYVERLVVLR